jgi:hypothetical protein
MTNLISTFQSVALLVLGALPILALSISNIQFF